MEYSTFTAIFSKHQTIQTLEDAWKQYSEFVVHHWPPSVIFTDENVTKILDMTLRDYRCVYVVALINTAKSIDANLRHHVPPTAAPPIPAAKPVPEKVQDSIGPAVSVEKPIPLTQAPSKPTTPITDAVKYAWNTQEYKQKLEEFRREARGAAIVNGVLNHAKEKEIFDKKKNELDAKIANANKAPIDLKKLEAEAYEKARRGGNSNYVATINRFKDGLGRD